MKCVFSLKVSRGWIRNSIALRPKSETKCVVVSPTHTGDDQVLACGVGPPAGARRGSRRSAGACRTARVNALIRRAVWPQQRRDGQMNEFHHRPTIESPPPVPFAFGGDVRSILQVSVVVDVPVADQLPEKHHLVGIIFGRTI